MCNTIALIILAIGFVLAIVMSICIGTSPTYRNNPEARKDLIEHM